MLQHLKVTCHFKANTQQPLPRTSVERERKRNAESKSLVPFITTRGAAGLPKQEARDRQLLGGEGSGCSRYRNERSTLHNAGDEGTCNILVQLCFRILPPRVSNSHDRNE
jgi:hypothetical protein